jgi:hypothetical protein
MATQTTVARVTEGMYVAFSNSEPAKRVTFHTRLGKRNYFVRLSGTPRGYSYAPNTRVFVATADEVKKIESAEATRLANKPKLGRPKGSKNKPKVAQEQVEVVAKATVTTSDKRGRGRPTTRRTLLLQESEAAFKEGNLDKARRLKRQAALS